jgi:hypothetical protein
MDLPPLTRSASLGTGIATAALVWGIYNSALPTLADARVSPANDKDLSKTERMATAASIAVVSGISLLAKDGTVFVIGGSMVVILAWWHRHANAANSLGGGAMTPGSRQVAQELRDATNAANGFTPGY